MTRKDFDIILIGGSSGSINTVIDILQALPASFGIPIVIVLHRLKNVNSSLTSLLSVKKRVCEPEDKEPVAAGQIYLAPQNFHLLIENDKTFSLDYSEPINYSRPAIDASFMTAADAYGPQTLGILLSGANKDGADGINRIIAKGGCCIVQDPATAESTTMPEAAIEKNEQIEIQTPGNIVDTLIHLSQ